MELYPQAAVREQGRSRRVRGQRLRWWAWRRRGRRACSSARGPDPPDVTNNSVVIYANAENYRVIERALNQLDRPQMQVAVDVTVAEVELNNTLNYGVQFFLGNQGIWGTISNSTSGLSTTGLSSPPSSPGFNLLIGSQLTPHVIINALNAYTTTKILANPSLVVLDNQVAALQVGDTVPVTTGSANILNSATSTSNTVFNSITYQNTGIVLSFRPHVHANGNVNLEIDQEISACKNCNNGNTSATGNLTPSFTDRHIKSSIQVPNGQTVLLAGLVQEEQDKSRSESRFSIKFLSWAKPSPTPTTMPSSARSSSSS